MTVKELSEYLRLDRMTIYKLLKESSIPASRIGHQWRFFKDDIDDWIRSRRVAPQISVLICDDDSETRALIESELSAEGLDVVVAESPEDALAYAVRRSFDCVFLGLNKSTVALFKGLRDVYTELPVVIVTGVSDGRLVDEAMQVGTFTLARRPQSAEDARNLISSVPLRKA